MIVTAWCGLQYELWGSTLTFELKAANTAHREYMIMELKERQEMMMDMIVFSQYVESKYDNNPDLSKYYQKSFRPEMEKAFEEWMGTDPFNSPEPGTPFDMPGYTHPANSETASSLLSLAEEKSAGADRLSSIASSYVLFTTVYSGISFLEGIGRVFPSRQIQKIFLVMGIVLFSITTVILFLSMPIAPFHI